jgi:hypothetical protein
MVRFFKKLKTIFEKISNKNQPIKPKISSRNNRAITRKTKKYMNIYTKRHLRPFCKSWQTKIDGMYMKYLDKIVLADMIRFFDKIDLIYLRRHLE